MVNSISNISNSDNPDEKISQGFSIVNYTILNGIAVLVEHRLFSIKNPVARREKYYVLRKAQNDEVDRLYMDMLEEETDGLYMLDIMRGDIKNDDARIPRNLSE